jgi:hypothetical protein
MDWLMADGAKGLNLTQCGMFLIPRGLIEKSGLWNGELSLIDDFEFFCRLIPNAKEIIYNPESIVYYRKDVPNSLSNISGDRALQSAFIALSTVTRSLLEKEDSYRVKKALAQYWSGWIYHFYYHRPDYYSAGAKQFFALTGKKYSPSNQGITGILDRLIGWKLTKKIKIKYSGR